MAYILLVGDVNAVGRLIERMIVSQIALAIPGGVKFWSRLTMVKM